MTNEKLMNKNVRQVIVIVIVMDFYREEQSESKDHYLDDW